MICRFFLAGNLCIPVDHSYLWCALLASKASCVCGVHHTGGACYDVMGVHQAQ